MQSRACGPALTHGEQYRWSQYTLGQPQYPACCRLLHSLTLTKYLWPDLDLRIKAQCQVTGICSLRELSQATGVGDWLLVSG